MARARVQRTRTFTFAFENEEVEEREPFRTLPIRPYHRFLTLSPRSLPPAFSAALIS